MITRHSSCSQEASHTDHSSEFLYLDIETTGLSRENTILYMIGCGYFEDGRLHVIQWFNDDGVSEPLILSRFLELLQVRSWVLLTFNGDSFDLPYLRYRFTLSGISSSSLDFPSCDLYRSLRPFQKLFDMPGGKQKDWEHFMGICREDDKSGRELITVYKDYLRYKDHERLHMLFLHNYEDICYLSRLTPLLAFRDLAEGQFSFREVNFHRKVFSLGQASLKFSCILKTPFTEAVTRTAGESFSMETNVGAFQAYGSVLNIFIPAVHGVMKHFYSDYSNYYYLPKEDRAIHKSVGRYVEKEYRQKCSAKNCYVKKEGVFLPVYSKNSLKLFTLYRPDYISKDHYIDLDELTSREESLLKSYLTGCLHILLKKNQKSS